MSATAPITQDVMPLPRKLRGRVVPPLESPRSGFATVRLHGLHAAAAQLPLAGNRGHPADKSGGPFESKRLLRDPLWEQRVPVQGP